MLTWFQSGESPLDLRILPHQPTIFHTMKHSDSSHLKEQCIIYNYMPVYNLQLTNISNPHSWQGLLLYCYDYLHSIFVIEPWVPQTCLLSKTKNRESSITLRRRGCWEHQQNEWTGHSLVLNISCAHFLASRNLCWMTRNRWLCLVAGQNSCAHAQ